MRRKRRRRRAGRTAGSAAPHRLHGGGAHSQPQHSRHARTGPRGSGTHGTGAQGGSPLAAAHPGAGGAERDPLPSPAPAKALNVQTSNREEPNTHKVLSLSCTHEINTLVLGAGAAPASLLPARQNSIQNGAGLGGESTQEPAWTPILREDSHPRGSDGAEPGIPTKGQPDHLSVTVSPVTGGGLGVLCAPGLCRWVLSPHLYFGVSPSHKSTRRGVGGCHVLRPPRAPARPRAGAGRWRVGCDTAPAPTACSRLPRPLLHPVLAAGAAGRRLRFPAGARAGMLRGGCARGESGWAPGFFHPEGFSVSVMKRGCRVRGAFQ